MKDFWRLKWRRFLFFYYCFVVFYFIKEFVLLGVLSFVYIFDGELKLFFFESDCCFIICLIFGDRREMLFDCIGDVNCIVLWSLDDGFEIICIIRFENVLLFVWFWDGRLFVIFIVGGLICLVDVVDDFWILVEIVIFEVCGMIKFFFDY